MTAEQVRELARLAVALEVNRRKIEALDQMRAAFDAIIADVNAALASINGNVEPKHD